MLLLKSISAIVARTGRRVPGIQGALRSPATSWNGTRSFDLLRWFSLLSLVFIVLLSAALGTVLSRFMTNVMIQRDAAISSQFVESFAHVRPAWSYFEGSQKAPPDPSLVAFFNSYFERLLIESDVIRANVYARDRTIIWSSTAGHVGTRDDSNHELRKALDGDVAVELGVVAADERAEHVDFAPEFAGEGWLECFIPIWSRDRQTVVGVVQIYRLTRELDRAIAAGRQMIWITTLAGGAVLYIALFGIVRKASRLIEQQEKRLIETESLAAIGEMASVVAHGIRNPLASIRSSAELAMIQDLNATRRAAKDIVSNVDRLSDWARSFLYQAHSGESGSALVEINAIVRTSLAELAATMQRQGISLTVDIQEPLPAVRGDRVALGHVLNSLFANALEAMPQGGKLQLATRSDDADRAVEVRIADSGPGIAQNMAGQVFKPFFTSKSGGLGLGLALSRRVIERYGGTLDLSGGSAKGSVATIRMPIGK